MNDTDRSGSPPQLLRGTPLLLILPLAALGCGDSAAAVGAPADADSAACAETATGVFDALLVSQEAVDASTTALSDGFVPTRQAGPEGGFWIGLGVFGSELPDQPVEMSFTVTTPRGLAASESFQLVPATGLDACVRSVAGLWGVSSAEISDLVAGDATLEVDLRTQDGAEVFSTTLAVGAE